MADAQRVEIGFEGGQVISARLAEDDLKDLRKQLEKGGWHDLHTEDGVISLYLGKVAFLRIASGDHRVGFGGRRPTAQPFHLRRSSGYRRFALPGGRRPRQHSAARKRRWFMLVQGTGRNRPPQAPHCQDPLQSSIDTTLAGKTSRKERSRRRRTVQRSEPIAVSPASSTALVSTVSSASAAIRRPSIGRIASRP